MPLTRDFRDTVKARVERDPAFRAGLADEIVIAVRNGEYSVAAKMLTALIDREPGS